VYLDWAVGDFVICIKDLKWYANKGETVPELGKVYTIRAFEADTMVCIFLVEIINEPRTYRQGFGECRFVATAFRKLQRKRIEVFTDMLTKIKESVRG
jgi:hypothetical protein